MKTESEGAFLFIRSPVVRRFAWDQSAARSDNLADAFDFHMKQVEDVAQAINLGNHGMSGTSDIPYHFLEAAHQQYLRLSTLKSANDRISNFIAGLAICSSPSSPCGERASSLLQVQAHFVGRPEPHALVERAAFRAGVQ